MILYIITLSKMAIKSKNPKIREWQSKVLRNFAIIRWMIHRFLRIEECSAFPWKNYVCDSKPELCTFCFQHWCEIHSIGNCQSINFMKFLDFLVDFQIPWLFPDFSGQFSNSLTFPGFPGSQASDPWTYYNGTLNILWQ